MRIESIRIENFRSFEDATVPFNKYACLVGPNGAGKSTVLTALNVFFRETENLPTDLSQLEQEDFHCKDTEALIRITVTFCDLSEEAQDDFSNYVRQGRKDPAEICFRPWLDPQPLQPRTPSQPPRNFQTGPGRRLGRVASIGSLRPFDCRF